MKSRQVFRFLALRRASVGFCREIGEIFIYKQYSYSFRSEIATDVVHMAGRSSGRHAHTCTKTNAQMMQEIGGGVCRSDRNHMRKKSEALKICGLENSHRS